MKVTAFRRIRQKYSRLVVVMAITMVALLFHSYGSEADATLNSVTLPAVSDAYLDMNSPARNYGASTTLRIVSRSGRNTRAVVLFDVSSIPAGSTVESALLRLFLSNAPGSPRTYDVYALSQSWLEGLGSGVNNSASINGVTWYERRYGDNLWTGSGAWDWATQGGDYAAVPTASVTDGTVNNTWVEWDVTGDVARWVAGAATNFGWLVRDSVESDPTRPTSTFASRENLTVANRPQLVVTYVAGSGTVAPSSTDGNTVTPFSVTIGNSGAAGADEIQQASFTVPAGYSGIPTAVGGYTVTTPSGKSWSITSLPSGSNGPQTITLSAAGPTDDLAPGESLRIDFSALTPVTPGPTLWTSSVTGRAGGVNTLADQTVNIVDVTPPDTAITAPSGGTLPGSSALVSGTASDNMAVSSVEVAVRRDSDGLYWDGSGWLSGPVWNTATITSGGGTPSATWQYSWSLPSDDGGSYQIEARSSDGTNTDASPATVPVNVDNTAPSISSFFINGGSSYTATDTVTLNSSVSGATQMRFAESTAALSSAPYQSYSALSGFTLSAGDGLKTVYAQYRDSVGNETAPGAVGSYALITYDATRPQLEFTDPASGQTGVTIRPDVMVHFFETAGIDPSTVSGVNFYLKDFNGATVPASISFNAASQMATLTPVNPLSRETTYTAYLTTGIADLAGNTLPVDYSWSFTTGAESHRTIQPSQDDTYLDQSLPSNNYGSDTFLKVASAPGANKRSLIKFDLSTLPSNISLLEEGILKLYLHQPPSVSRNYQAKKITSSWTGSGATWNTRDGLTNWTSPGGDMAAATDTTATGITDHRFVSWDITQDVRDWYTAAATNYGMAIVDATENDTGTAYFYSQDHTDDPSLRPKLEVGYLATTATVSPSSVYPGQNRQFTVTVANVGDAYAAPIYLVHFHIPTGYTDIPMVGGAYTVTASNGGTWEITGLPSAPTGPQEVIARAVSEPLSGDENVQITFNATTPLTPGSTSWDVHAEDDDLDVVTHSVGVNVQNDVTPPTTSITDPIDGFVTTSTTNLAVTGTAEDTESGVKQVDVRVFDPDTGRYWNGSTSTWQTSEYWNQAAGANNWSYVWQVPTTDKRSYRVTARATDFAGNSEAPLGSQITLFVDNVGPASPSIQIETGAAYATTQTVTLAPLSASDSSTVSSMSFSNNGSDWSPWEGYASSRAAWNLNDVAYGGSGGGGTKTVYARFRDAVGNVSVSASDSIEMDVTRPTVLSVDPPDGSSAAPLDTTVTVTFNEINGMDATTIDENSFYLRHNGTDSVTATVTFDPATNTAYLKPALKLDHDHQYTAYLADTIKDNAGNSLASVYSWTFQAADAVPPDTSIVSPIAGSTVTGTDLLITGLGTDNDDVSAVTVSITRASDGLWWDGVSGGWVASSVDNTATITSGYLTPNATWQFSWPLPSDNGQDSYTIIAKAFDDSGNADPTVAVAAVTVDNTPPQVSAFSINGGDSYTLNTNVTLSSDVTEAVEMRFAESTAALQSQPWHDYASSAGFNLSAGDGVKTVYAQYRDVNGNVTVPGAVFDGIIVDSAAPNQSGVFPSEGSTSASRDTVVTIDFLEANEMDASSINSGSFFLKDAADSTVTASVSYDANAKRATLTPTGLLTEGETYTVYATGAIKDAAGNAFSPYSWSFTIADSTPPDTVITDPTGGTLVGSSYLITGGASDNIAVNGVRLAIIRDSDGYYFRSSDSSWVPAATWNDATVTAGVGTPSASWQLNWQLPTSDNGSFTVQARSTDGAANSDLTPAQVTVNVDNVAPNVGSFTIEDGAGYATTSTVTLNSNVTGAAQMRFAETTASLSSQPWQPYASTAGFTLSAGEGQRTVYAQYRDAAGNSTALGSASDSITVDTTKPQVASVYPADGATDVSLSVMVTGTLSDNYGVDPSTISGNTFYLKDSAGTTVTASVSFNEGAGVASLVPQGGLSYDTTYTARLTTGVKDMAGNALAADKIWSFRTVAPSDHPPAAPTNLTVVAGDMRNSLSWTAPAPASDPAGDFNPPAQGGYNVYRSSSKHGPWERVNGTLVKETTYVDTVVTPGRYYYRVVAVDGASSESAPTAVKTNDEVNISKSSSTDSSVIIESANGKIKLVVPEQPSVTNISAVTAASYPAGVTPVTEVFDLGPDGATFSTPLTITIRTPGNPTGARIYYHDGNSWKEVSGGTYSYNTVNQTVSYDNITHFSYYTVTNNTDTTPPSAPGNLTLANQDTGQIKLDWSAASDLESGISGYIVYRSLSSFNDGNKSSLAQVVATPGNVLTYTDSSVIPGENYFYAVSAENGAGLEGPISSTETTTSAGKQLPHRDYSSNSNLCRICHVVHKSPAQVKIFRKAPEIENCYVCHDGTGSDFNIRVTFEDMAAHDTSMTASSSTNIKCTNCHNPHGVGYARMTRASEEDLCFKCHNSTQSSKNGWNVQAQFNSASRHAITGTTADGLTGAKVECTSCHGPHTSQQGNAGSDFTKRLVDPFNTYNLWTGTFTGFCLQCHKASGFPEATATVSTFVPYTISFPLMSPTMYPLFPGWDKSQFTASRHNDFMTCQRCHQPHGADNPRLNAFFSGTSYDDTASTAREENLCFNCHDSSKWNGAPNIKTEFQKANRHPVPDNSLSHSDTETAGDLAFGNKRHAECTDCHDVHKAKAGTSIDNNAGPPLNGVLGVSVSNGPAGSEPTYGVDTAVAKEYQVCFKCHSGWTAQPNSSAYFATTSGAPNYTETSPIAQGNKGIEFNPNNSAFHPIEAAGRSQSANLDAQLTAAGLSTTSTLKCSDCHNNNALGDAGVMGPSANFAGVEAKGTHGSANSWLLRAPYNRNLSFPRGAYNQNDYKLCFSCHDVLKLLGTTWWQSGGTAQTNFWRPGGGSYSNLHKVHVVDRGDRCADCHYNIHSNQQARNTEYWDTQASVQYYDGPPASILTHMVNFAPHVEKQITYPFQIYQKPMWGYNPVTRVRNCALRCHRADGSQNVMDYSYGPAPSGD